MPDLQILSSSDVYMPDRHSGDSLPERLREAAKTNRKVAALLREAADKIETLADDLSNAI